MDKLAWWSVGVLVWLVGVWMLVDMCGKACRDVDMCRCVDGVGV